MKIGILKETQNGEKRVAITPNIAKQLIALGFEILVEEGAGVASSFKNSDYSEVNANTEKRATVLNGAQILIKINPFDKEDLESKKDKTFEKYHSDWGDDYEELGQRRNTKEDKEFRNAARNDELPNYYETLGVTRDATHDEIKKKFRELAKKTHPDKTKEDSEEEMVELNKAYEILSDKELREKYDRYLKVD